MKRPKVNEKKFFLKWNFLELLSLETKRIGVLTVIENIALSSVERDENELKTQ